MCMCGGGPLLMVGSRGKMDAVGGFPLSLSLSIIFIITIMIIVTIISLSISLPYHHLSIESIGLVAIIDSPLCPVTH